MWEDPIVADVRKTREKLSAEHSYDVKAIFADLMKRQTALGDRLVKQNAHSTKTLQPVGVDAETLRNGAATVP